MRIAFAHDWEPDIEQELTQQDGIFAAVAELRRRGHEIEVFTVGTMGRLPHPLVGSIFFVPAGQKFFEAVAEFKPDVILHWADMTRPHAEGLKKLGLPMAICFAGGNPFGPNWHLFDHIFVESDSYKSRFLAAGLTEDQVSTAFGTNTKLFTPVSNQKKVFDVIFPATYCDWKRHPLLAQALQGLNVVTAGFMYQDHEVEDWQCCQRAGFLTLPHVSAQVLRHLYAASRLCVVTSDTTGGSQRTVLEAMAMNVPVIAMSDSDKTSEYLYKSGLGHVITPDPLEIRQTVQDILAGKKPELAPARQYILDNWSEIKYADALEAGLKKIVKI